MITCFKRTFLKNLISGVSLIALISVFTSACTEDITPNLNFPAIPTSPITITPTNPIPVTPAEPLVTVTPVAAVSVTPSPSPNISLTPIVPTPSPLIAAMTRLDSPKMSPSRVINPSVRKFPLSNNADLSSLVINSGTLSPVFTSNQTTYAASVNGEVSEILITPTVSEINAKIRVNENRHGSGSPFSWNDLKAGINEINISVTAEDGSTKNYTIKITRAASSNSTLLNLVLSNGELDPPLNKIATSASYLEGMISFIRGTKTHFKASVPNSVNTITVTSTAKQMKASVRINGELTHSGSASTPIELSVGSNAIDVVVTAEDLRTIHTYSIEVTRRSNNATLSNLSITSGEFNRKFDPNHNDYKSIIAGSNKISVTPTLTERDATVEVDGVDVKSNSASPAKVLSSGPNRITIETTTKDKLATNTYWVDVYFNSGKVTTVAPVNRITELDQFSHPDGVAVDSVENIYVADRQNHQIRKITPDGSTSLLAGSGDPEFNDGTREEASFNLPSGIAVDSHGNVYVADSGNHTIRKITPDGRVTSIAGSTVSGYTNGNGTAARFSNPHGICIDDSQNIYIADQDNHLIRKIDPNGNVSTIAGAIEKGFRDGRGALARFYFPSGIAIDSNSNLFIADRWNHSIRKIRLEDAMVTTIAGLGYPGHTNNEGYVTPAAFNSPSALTVDSSGNITVADTGNHLIRRITREKWVTTLAGSNEPGDTNGIGTAARFRYPSGIATDQFGIIYIGDSLNNRIQKIE